MKALSGNEKMTLKEISEITGAAYSTVAAYARKAGWTQNGKKTLLDEWQATIIIEAMKDGAESNHSNDLLSSIEGVETSLTPVLQMELLQRQAVEIERKINAIVTAEKDRIAAELKKSEQENRRLEKENQKAIAAKEQAVVEKDVAWKVADWLNAKNIERRDEVIENAYGGKLPYWSNK